jgi:hypothetical protein
MKGKLSISRKEIEYISLGRVFVDEVFVIGQVE